MGIFYRKVRVDVLVKYSLQTTDARFTVLFLRLHTDLANVFFDIHIHVPRTLSRRVSCVVPCPSCTQNKQYHLSLHHCDSKLSEMVVNSAMTQPIVTEGGNNLRLLYTPW